jgi:cysteine protease ATG4
MDPSMLMGFLIRDEADWQSWRQGISSVSGKTIIHIADREGLHHRMSVERDGAIDEVETFDTEEE